MLLVLLRTMARSREPLGVHELGERLGVSEELVRAMLEDLARRGLLSVTSASTCAGGACHGCGPSTECTSQDTLKLWMLTEKGRRLAEA